MFISSGDYTNLSSQGLGSAPDRCSWTSGSRQPKCVMYVSPSTWESEIFFWQRRRVALPLLRSSIVVWNRPPSLSIHLFRPETKECNRMTISAARGHGVHHNTFPKYLTQTEQNSFCLTSGSGTLELKRPKILHVDASDPDRILLPRMRHASLVVHNLLDLGWLQNVH